MLDYKCIKEGKTMNRYEQAVYEVFEGDKWYSTKFGIPLNKYLKVLKDTIYECFNSEFNPYLDKEYLDMCWLKVDGLIINLDDIHDVLMEMLKEME
jgi:hypothetical protein